MMYESMMNEHNCRYTLAIGYGDDCWDLGEDRFHSDSLEALWEEMPGNMALEELKKRMEKEGYVEDEEYGMWFIRDNRD